MAGKIKLDGTQFLEKVNNEFKITNSELKLKSTGNTIVDSSGNAVVSESGGNVTLGNVRLPATGGIKDSSGNNILTESGGNVSIGNIRLNANSSVRDSSGNAIITDVAGSAVVAPSAGGIPPGAIMSFAMSSAPAGWIVCNGAEYAIADYGDLHTAIGTTWGALTNGSGGAGSTHFRVPDLSGAFLRGSGTQTYTNTYNGGSVGDKSIDTFKSHTHSLNYYSSGGGSLSPYGGSRYTATFNGDTNATGGTETKPFNATILYCIKY